MTPGVDEDHVAAGRADAIAQEGVLGALRVEGAEEHDARHEEGLLLLHPGRLAGVSLSQGHASGLAGHR